MRSRLVLPFAVLALVALLLGGRALAAPLAPAIGEAINWWVVATGGGSSTGEVPGLFGGGAVTIDSTVGQPIAGDSSGTGITLGAGYWYGAQGQYTLYLPSVLRIAGTP